MCDGKEATTISCCTQGLCKPSMIMSHPRPRIYAINLTQQLIVHLMANNICLANITCARLPYRNHLCSLHCPRGGNASSSRFYLERHTLRRSSCALHRSPTASTKPDTSVLGGACTQVSQGASGPGGAGEVPVILGHNCCALCSATVATSTRPHASQAACC